MLRAVLSFFQWQYEITVAPFLAQRMRWLLWPLYVLCKRLRICFVVNIISTTGHIVVELDYFFRMRALKKIDPEKRYVWVKKKDPYSTTCMKLYGKQFWWSSHNRLSYLFLLPLTMAFPDIVFDAGISRLKWQLPKTRKYREFKKGCTYLHQVSKSEGIERTIQYYQRILESANIFPLREVNFEGANLLEALTIKRKKIALVHLKDVVRNCTALVPDPKSYMKSLEYLKSLGYSLVFIGREKMPTLFLKYGVINYSESRFANFFNDLYLFYVADIVLLTGSGISVLADCMDVHYLYLNSWHLSIPPFSRKSIFVPALVQYSGEWLSFSEQNQLYRSLADVGPESFPSNEYTARNATEEEVFMATKELLELKGLNSQKNPPTSLQERFRCLDRTAPLFYAQSRCSDFFLQKHQARF